MPRVQVSIALSALLFATPTPATTLHVPSEYPTIAAGLNAATYGDTVEVACGVYAEGALTMDGGITLRSETGATGCVTIDPSLMGIPPDYSTLHCTGASATVEGITFQNSSIFENGGALLADGSVRVTGCRFLSNRCKALASGAGIYAEDSLYCADTDFIQNRRTAVVAFQYARFDRCDFVANDAYSDASGGAFVGSGEFIDCSFASNGAYFDGGAIYGNNIKVVRCVFAYNEAGLESTDPWSGGAIDAAVLIATDCTFHQNMTHAVGSATPDGATIKAGSGLIGQCIIVGSPCGEECGTTVAGGPGLIIECTNIWYPTADAWAGSIGSQLGQNGNISVDPMFCDAPGGDFRLSSLSPCLDAPCGNMGAFGLGCFDAKPRIISIADVGNDQGRQVRLTWYRANDDFSGSPFNGYAIYRRQDQFATAPDDSRERQVEMIPGWDYVTTVPSHWDDVYQAVVPTLCDSTITSGQCWSAFMVSAMTPTAFYDSPIDSGYSKDNLAPPTPGNFAVAYNTGSGNRLVWDAVAAGDWAGFRVYRGTSPGFSPSLSALVSTTTQTTWNDPAFDGWDVYYRVTAFDAAGNESSPTASSAVSGTGVIAPPLALELGPNVPNPFNPTTTIPFTVPSAGRVTIAIYDVSGARVRLVVDQGYQPGHHSAVWDGKNDAGSVVGSGVYLARLAHDGQTRTRKLILMK